MAFLEKTGSALIYNYASRRWEIIEPWDIIGRGDVLARAKNLTDLNAEVQKLSKPGIIEKALIGLVNFTVPYRKEQKYLFFTEGYLYAKIGKDHARYLLSLLHHLCERLGFDLRKLQNLR